MFDFPNSPTTNQVVIGQRGEAYIWDGWKWVAGAGPTPPPGTLYLPLSGGALTGMLTLTGGLTLSPIQTTQPPAGSGIVWSNGGVLMVA